MLKLKQAELEEIKEVQKAFSATRILTTRGFVCTFWLATATKRRDAFR